MSDDEKHRARIFLHRGDLVQARAAWEAAVAEDRVGVKQHALSASLGNTCALINEFIRAEQCYREVLQIQPTEHNLTAVAHTFVNLGNLHIASDHPEKARPFYLEAMDLLRQLQDNHSLGILYNNLALQVARDGQWDQALASFKQLGCHIGFAPGEKGLRIAHNWNFPNCLPMDKCR